MSGLQGRRVLLVEDESLVAMLGEDMLLDLGCEVEVAMRLDKAIDLARRADLDMAILDVNLGETCSYPVADALFERGIPFIFATGYGLSGIEPAYQAIPVMQKPYQVAQMERLLRHLLTCETPSSVRTVQPLPCGCSFWAKIVGPLQIRAD
ncbi:response regulator [Methylobacterium sp. Leaf89]|jgi:CheY-like chemotaxis protein|uniref:response regulator n=1 Tax=Methylobacterium sp. Leaf89 TaxID=1736245 RepID=UPI0006F1C73F|nr:response regulator [Methylobacterium sp. Leaf89]KQO67047.1 transcriptional regulator [Methylobacterium sp. Leaf89]